MKKLLLVTDFYYEAKGREYFREDLALGCFLRNHFTLYMAHIEDALSLVDHVDAVLIRNTGPKTLHMDALATLKERKDLVMCNDLQGKGDIIGKQHLLELYQAGYPVIPSFTHKANVQAGQKYLLKPLDGADSQGVEIVSWDMLKDEYDNMVIQPVIDFVYEVSFYFLGTAFYYALHAPDPTCRWKLIPYKPSDKDIDFARQFILWNSCRQGIQRVDACRLADGTLLLMELEDYNPFLSLDCVPGDMKKRFLDALVRQLA